MATRRPSPLPPAPHRDHHHDHANLHHRHRFHGVLEAFSHLVKRGLDLFDATEAAIDTTGDGQAASPAPASLHTVHTPSTPPCTRV